MEELGTTAAVLLALLSAAVLAVLHLLAPRIRRLPLVPERVTASFAGGIAVSYVFLHLLPELAEGNERVGELLAEEGGRSPLVGLEVFLVALVGFTAFYGLERLADRHHPRERAGVTPAGAGSRPVFRLHLASFALYNGVIGYSLPLGWQASAAFALLFTIAIGLHFVLSDRGLEEQYGPWFDCWPPRLVLAAALLAGWALAAVFAPTSGLVVSLLTAFIAGSVLLNVVKEEIPSSRQSHFGWFATGLAAYALLLALVTAAEETDEAAAAGRTTQLSVPVTTPDLSAPKNRRAHSAT